MATEKERRREVLQANLIMLKNYAHITTEELSANYFKGKEYKVSRETIHNVMKGFRVSEATLDKMEPTVRSLVLEYKLPFCSCPGQIKTNGEVR